MSFGNKKRFVFPKAIQVICEKHPAGQNLIHFSPESTTSFHRDPKETYFLANSNLSFFRSFLSGGREGSLGYLTLELFCRALHTVWLNAW